MGVSARSLAGLVTVVVAVSLAHTWWTRRGDDDLARQLRAEVRHGELRMLSSDTCAICVSARRWLGRHDIAFKECSIERNPQCAADYLATGAPGTPVFLFRGRSMLGFEPKTMHLWLSSQD